MTRRSLLAIAVVCTALTLLTATSASAQWRPIVRQCATGQAAPGCTLTPTFIGGTWNVGVSPDGRTAYALSLGSNTGPRPGRIHVFTRNPATGALTLKPGADGCLTSIASAGCTTARGIGRPDEIMFSADGRFVYVSSNEDVVGGLAAAVAVFSRNTTTGVLQQLNGLDGCINDDATEGCLEGHAIGGRGALLSPDQRNVYVLGTESLAVLNRNTTTGVLSQPPPGCFGLSGSGDNCVDLTPRPGGRQLAISADGRQIYTPAGLGPGAPPGSGGLRVFARDTATGALTAGGCITQGVIGACGRVAQITPFPQNIVISPDSRHVYLSGSAGIVTFARGTNGALAFANCINDAGNLGCANSSNTSSLSYVAMSPDGEDVVANPQGSPGGITAFARNAGTGALVRRAGQDGCITPDGRGFDNGVAITGACRASGTVGQFGHVRFFGNGSILAGFLAGDRIVEIKRDFYPVCQSRSVRVPRNTAQAIPLTCADRNGDPLTRSIVQPPEAGRLGAVNQAAGTVFYSPFNGFGGNDRFTFRASAAGLTSAAATINVRVPGRRARPIRGVTLAFTFNAFSDHTVLTRLQVKGLPRGSRVRAVCTFRGRRCAGRARKAFVKKRARGTVSLKRFAGVDLRVGSRISVVVTKRGMIGSAKLMTMRSRRAPKIVSRCLRPGSNTLRKRC